ncbi:DUF5304 family protein [Streptomyces sp. NPDC005438]|uniref:DUF5304 family protein n=1 Tax=Streptomyces sp. NPDC005438 TaxID=3156880 RepID=UPI0033B538A6
MSDAAERPDSEPTDPDAWATACEEDLADQRARHRERYGPPPVGSAAEELRRLADALSRKVNEVAGPLATSVGGYAAQNLTEQLVQRARQAFEPVAERHPQVLDHLAAAGQELLSAYRAVVTEHERDWTTGRTSGVPRTRGTEDGGAGGAGEPSASGEPAEDTPAAASPTTDRGSTSPRDGSDSGDGGPRGGSGDSSGPGAGEGREDGGPASEHIELD